MWAPFVNVNHLWLAPVKCWTRSGQWPPVCSSSHWQTRNVGTLILLTNVTGSRGSATDGLYVELAWIFAIRSAASAGRTWLWAQVLSPSFVCSSAWACVLGM